ncbi:MAG: hypothetical protein J1F11_02620 [Oscillospiraceae bacterium]|nr:hypothetical protein [Oscillospiraceae bacterium]
MKKIIFITACLSAIVSMTYAMWQKRTAENRILETEIKTMLKFRRVSKQDLFPQPTENDLQRFNGKSCKGIAYQLDNNTYSDDDYGNFSRECAALILNALAKNLPDGKSLAEYFSEKGK